MARGRPPGRGKYRPRYARQLREGLRAQGLSVEQVCQLWKITRGTYEYWKQNNPDFEEAHEHGERDFSAFWYSIAVKQATGEMRGYPNHTQFVLERLTNIQLRREEKQREADSPVHTINIRIIEPPALEHRTDGVIEGELLETSIPENA